MEVSGNLDTEMIDETNDNNNTMTLMEGDHQHNNNLHYKFNSPMYNNDLDWTTTLSRNDFPWNEIRFGDFSSKDCYEKYSSIVKDSQTFLKKVLGMKEKYKKMMQN